MISSVKWESASSRPFNVPLGIKQGGINSPDFFSIYVDDLTRLLRSKGSGCHMYRLFVAAILFADDICLIAPTRSSLQELIDCCSDYCHKFCLTFNPKKSKVVVFSPRTIDTKNFARISLNGIHIEYVNSVKYLGLTLCSRPTFSFDSKSDLRNFYRSANSILNVLKKPDECVLLHLLYSNCVPILTYACAVKTYASREMNDCNTALNNAIRRIFTYHRWESIRSLRVAFGYKSLTEIFQLSSKRFIDSLPNHSNSILRKLHSSISVE